MGTIVITGSASGIGAATRDRLEASGHRVIGVDLAGAEVVADLATPEGRDHLVEAVGELSGGAIDGLVAGAGVNGEPGPHVMSVNYFGAVATLAGLRPLLARGVDPAAVAISSNSTTAQAYPLEWVDACAAGDEAGARALAEGDPQGLLAYPASKSALARWVRRQAVGPEWIGAGIRLNAVAPGFIDTPMTEGMAEFVLGLGDLYPIPIGRAGRAPEIAALLAFLLGGDSSFLVGSVVFADGGSDAALRAADWPAPLPADG